MTGLLVFAVVAAAFGVLSALFVLWTMRKRADVFARRARYNMLGTISLGVMLPAGLLLKERLGIVPFLVMLIALFATGSFFLNKARGLER